MRPRTMDQDVLVNTSRRMVYVGMFFLPLLSIRVASNADLSDVIFALAAIVLALTQVRSRVPSTPMWYLGSFLVVMGGVASSFVASSPTSSLVVVANGIYLLFVWQWSLKRLLTNAKRVQTAMTAFVLGSALSAAVAIIQTEFHTLGYHPTLGVTAGASTRALGLTQQPNIAGVTYALSLTLGIGLVLHLGFGRRWYRLISILLIATALIFSASVSGMASALLGTFVLLFRRGMSPRILLFTAAIFVGVYVTATSLQGSGNGGQNLNPIARIQETTGTGTGYNTVNPRVNTLKNAWKGIQDSPLNGHGLDQTSGLVYYDPDLGISYPTHNLFLLLWYEGGILLLVGVLINFATAFRRLTRTTGVRDPTRDMLLSGAVVVLAFSMQSPELFDRWLWLPFVLAMTFRRGEVEQDDTAQRGFLGRSAGRPALKA